MGDEKLKQELLYMVSLTSKYDFNKMEVVEGILRLENERKILGSVFGRRFKSRIFDIAAGINVDGNCVICGQPADNKVICEHCMSTISGSEYAHSKLKNTNNKSKINFKKFGFYLSKIKKNLLAKTEILKNRFPIFKSEKKRPQDSTDSVEIVPEKTKGIKAIGLYIVAACLIMILFIQIWILKLWQEIPDINPKEEAKVSSYDLVPVSNQEEAYKQLAMDFPETDGYTITYGRLDRDYSGRFLLDKGECCEETEEQLTEEERYDYFMSEDVYIFYISCQADYISKVGLAEINEAGAILVMGSFNDGRRTDYRYKYR